MSAARRERGETDRGDEDQEQCGSCDDQRHRCTRGRACVTDNDGGNNDKRKEDEDRWPAVGRRGEGPPSASTHARAHLARGSHTLAVDLALGCTVAPAHHTLTDCSLQGTTLREPVCTPPLVAVNTLAPRVASPRRHARTLRLACTPRVSTHSGAYSTHVNLLHVRLRFGTNGIASALARRRTGGCSPSTPSPSSSR